VTPRDRTAGLLGAALLAAVYLPPLVAGRALPARDLAATQAPWRWVWREQVAAGHLPLWDRYSNQGRPLLANPNAMALYPGTLLALVLPPEAAVSWHVALHHLLLLTACGLLARRAGASPGAAAVAGAAVATSGIAWSLTTLANSQASLAWAVIAVATAVPPPGRTAAARRALVGGVALGLAFLGGEPVVAALGGIAWTLVVVTLWRPFAALHLALTAAAAAGVAAPVLVPLLAVYPDTVRATLGVPPGALAADTLAPRRFLELLLPHLLGEPLADGATGFWAARSFPWQRYFPLLFTGALPLLALPFARRTGMRLTPWWVLAAAGLGGSLLLAAPGVADRAAVAPGLGTARYGVKLLLLTLLALPPLVASGLERLWQAPAARRRAAAAVLALAAGIGVAALAAPAAVRAMVGSLYPRSRAALQEVTPAHLRRDLLLDAAALAVPSAALLVSPAAVPLCLAVVAANVSSGVTALAFDDAAAWGEPPLLARRLGSGATVAVFATAAGEEAAPGDPRLGRFWSSRAALVSEYGTRWGITYTLARGPDGLEPALQDLLAAEVRHLDAAARARVARALGAHAVIGESPLNDASSQPLAGVWLTPLADTGPEAYLARRELPAEGIPAVVRTLATVGFTPAADTVVGGTGGARTLAGGTLTTETDGAGRRRYRVTSDGPGLLVVRQSHMRCWKARIDGRLVVTEAVNGAQLGVRVPAGTHEVELFVDPAPALAGLLGPFLVLLAFAVTRRGAASPAHRAASGAGERSNPATPPER